MGILDAPAPRNPIGSGHLVDQTGHLPRLVIDTVGAVAVTDTSTYRDASMTINGSIPYSGAIQIRGRGNSTWLGAKKPYRLKLATAAPLLGMPVERDWVLLACFFDNSAIRNAMALEMSRRRPGLAWTPRSRFVEVTLNGAFLGLYMLTEHIEVSSPNKIDVAVATGTSGLALTGAYTLEIDQREPTFRTTRDNLPIAMQDPESTTAEHKTYIQNWLNTFEAALYATNWLDPVNGYAKYIDRDSFIDWYLVNELMKNLDSNGFSSIKCTKTRDTATVPGKLFMGPVWDFDLSMSSPATGFHTITPVEGRPENPGMTWIKRMMQDPAFFAALIERWGAFRTSLTTGDTMFAVMDRLADRLIFAINRDKAQWGYSVDTAYIVSTMRTYLKTRMDWLSAQFQIDTTPPSVPTNLAGTAGDAQALLSWTASTDNASVYGYKVRRGGVIVGSPTGTSFVDTGLTNGTAQSYTVSAIDAAGNESPQSVAVSITPAAPVAAPAFVESFTGTDGAPWPTGWSSGGCTVTMQGNRGRMVPVSYYGAAIRGDMAGLVGDFDIVGAFSFNGNTGDQFVTFGASTTLGSGSYMPFTGYALRCLLRGGKIIGLYPVRVKDGTRTEIAFSYPSITAGVDSQFKVRFQRSGTLIRGRAWAAGTAEPTTWQTSVTDSDPVSSALKLFLGIEAPSTASVDFDDLRMAAAPA